MSAKPRPPVEVLDDEGNVIAVGVPSWERESPLGDLVDVASNGRRITTLVSRTRPLSQPQLRRPR